MRKPAFGLRFLTIFGTNTNHIRLPAKRSAIYVTLM